MEKQWDRKVVGKARERNAEKKKKLQVKPAEAGGRSFPAARNVVLLE